MRCPACRIGVRGAAVEAHVLLGRRRVPSSRLGRGFDGYLARLARRPRQIAGAQRLVLAFHQVVLSWLAVWVVTRSSQPKSSSKSARKWTIDWRRSSVPASPSVARTEMPCAARWCSTTTGWVDGHVCSALLEVLGDGITELAHDLRDERNRPRPLRAQADRRRSAAPWPSARRSARAPRVPVRGSRASRVGCARPVRIPPRATAGRNSAVGRPAPAVEA
jgi:hypothetical protein